MYLCHSNFDLLFLSLNHNPVLDTIVAEPKEGLSTVNLNLRDSLGDTPLSLALKSDMQHLVPDLIAGMAFNFIKFSYLTSVNNISNYFVRWR